MEIVSYLLETLKNIILILAAGVLPWLAVSCIMQWISNSLRQSLVGVFGIKGYISLTAPGVMIHELSHAFFCLVFRHRIVKMKLFSPEKDGTLGYVNHQYNPKSIYQRTGNFFIGTGPVWGGITVLALLSYWLLPPAFFSNSDGFFNAFTTFFAGFFSLSFWTDWQSWLWLYLAFTTASHITLSKPDLEGAADGITVIASSVSILCLVLGWLGNWENAIIHYLWNFFLDFVPLFLLLTAIGGVFALFFRMIVPQK